MIVFQPKPQFQPSSKGGQNTTASTSSLAKPASEPLSQPFSYAEYIVQSKSNVAAPTQREGPSKPLRTEGAGVTNLRQIESDSVSSASGERETVQNCAKETESGSEGVKESEEAQVADTDQKEGSCQRSYPSLGPKPLGSGSSIIVSPRQVCINMYAPLDFGNSRLHSHSYIHPLCTFVFPFRFTSFTRKNSLLLKLMSNVSLLAWTCLTVFRLVRWLAQQQVSTYLFFY